MSMTIILTSIQLIHWAGQFTVEKSNLYTEMTHLNSGGSELNIKVEYTVFNHLHSRIYNEACCHSI